MMRTRGWAVRRPMSSAHCSTGRSSSGSLSAHSCSRRCAATRAGARANASCSPPLPAVSTSAPSERGRTARSRRTRSGTRSWRRSSRIGGRRPSTNRSGRRSASSKHSPCTRARSVPQTMDAACVRQASPTATSRTWPSVCSLFNVIVRIADTLGFDVPPDEFFEQDGGRPCSNVATSREPASPNPPDRLLRDRACVAHHWRCWCRPWQPASIDTFFFHARMFFVVHLLTLGWITHSIIGATYLAAPDGAAHATSRRASWTDGCVRRSPSARPGSSRTSGWTSTRASAGRG